ncbi:MAG TPA: sodium/solute symporter [Anseongella sp.]
MESLDYIFLVVYFLIIFMIGSFFSKSQKSLKDYFLGSRNIPWWAAAFSGMATIVSAIAYIGGVGLGFTSDFSFLQYRLGLPIAALVICVIILPFFYNLQLYSIYEYLEKRFNLAIRLIASGIFVIFKCCYLAIAIYAPALIIEVITGIDIVYIVLLTGIVTALYTLLGGIKSVIWTDTLQLFILLGGIIAVIFIAVSGVEGGMDTVLLVGREHEKFHYFNTSLSLTDTYTIWNGLIGGTFLMISQFGTDQAELQRFLTTSTLKRSILALVCSLLAATALGFLIFFEGVAIFAFYEQTGDANIEGNQVFVRFLVDELPVGVRGFLLAGLFAAAMSTISSVLNSLTTVTLSDFYQRLGGREPTVRMARLVTFGFGLVATLMACFGGLFGNVLEAAMATINFFGGGLVGLFLLGMLSKKATSRGALIGWLAGFLVVLPLATLTDLAYMWYSAVTATITFLVGYVVSLMKKQPLTAEQDKLIYRGRFLQFRKNSHI